MRRSKSLTVLYNLVTDAMNAGRLETDGGTTHATLSVGESLNYIEAVFADYKRYAGVGRFSGRVAELGPGDNCGVALLFLADGCEHIDLADRYYSRRDAVRQTPIYEAIIERYPSIRRHRLQPGADGEPRFAGVARHYGSDSAAETFFDRNRGYDCIVSRSVLEHVSDPPLVFRRMSEALNPGGLLIHKVDLRDHRLFSPEHDDLTFLTIPDPIYRGMVRNSGRPNRFMLHSYRDALSDLDIEWKILVTKLVGEEELEPHRSYDDIPSPMRARAAGRVGAIRNRLAASLRSASDEDLSVAGFFLVARKL